MRSTRPVAALACIAVAALATGCQDDVKPAPSKPGKHGQSDEGGGKSGGSGGGSHASPHTVPNADAGKTLPLGQPTRVRYKRPGKATGLLDVAASKVRKGSRSDMKDANLSPKELAKQPYYVTMTYRNAGKKSVTFPDTPVGVQAAGGGKVTKVITAGDDVKPCPAAVDSTEVRPGKKRSNCTVFLLPAGKSPKSVWFRMDFDKQPVFWRPTR